MGLAVSPLQIKILLHYWACLDDFNEGDFFPPAIREAIDYFVSLGLLISGPEREHHEWVKYHGNREALSLYVEELCSVPIPVKQWVIPKVSKT